MQQHFTHINLKHGVWWLVTCTTSSFLPFIFLTRLIWFWLAYRLKYFQSIHIFYLLLQSKPHLSPFLHKCLYYSINLTHLTLTHWSIFLYTFSLSLLLHPLWSSDSIPLCPIQCTNLCGTNLSVIFPLCDISATGLVCVGLHGSFPGFTIGIITVTFQLVGNFLTKKYLCGHKCKNT